LIIKNLDSTCENDDFNKLAYHLKRDKNKNVSTLFENIQNIKLVSFTEEESETSNDIFTNKMNILREEFGIVRNLPINSKLKTVEIKVNKTNTVKTTIGINDLNTEMETQVKEEEKSTSKEDVVMTNENSEDGGDK
jgi:hypothetical protein